MPESHAMLDVFLDVEPLRAQLEDHPELFGQYPMRGDFEGSPHAEMTDIWVRYNDIKPHLESGDFSTFGDPHDSIWYPSADLLPQAKAISFALMAHVNGERLGGVLITKLPAGGKIARHVDGGWHAAYYRKYYVPVQNAPGSVFAFEDGVITPEMGRAYWFDNSYPHWVENNSAEDRIAMIVCIRTDTPRGN